MDHDEFESLLFDAAYDVARSQVKQAIEGATTIQEAAALLDVSILFHSPHAGREGVFGLGLDKAITLKIDPNLRTRDQWSQLRHGLTLALMYRDKPEWFASTK